MNALTPLKKNYKGFTVCGSAEPVHHSHNHWFATARVLLIKPNNTCLEVDRFQDKLLTYADEDLAKWFGFGLAKITVDECLPTAWFTADRWILAGLSTYSVAAPKSAESGKYVRRNFTKP